MRIRMPALRERGDDVPQIVDFCLQNLFKQRKARASKVSPEAMAILVRYRWPGNVRELENVIYRSAVIAQGEAILVKNLPSEILEAAGEGEVLSSEAATGRTPSAGGAAPDVTPKWTLEHALDFVYAELARGEAPLMPQLESAMKDRALRTFSGDLAKTTAQLGSIEPRTEIAPKKKAAPAKRKT
jgi:two-component system nitrogen regulation response regulator GlnG